MAGRFAGSGYGTMWVRFDRVKRYTLECAIVAAKSTFVGRIQFGFSFTKLKPSQDALFRFGRVPIGERRVLWVVVVVDWVGVPSSYSSTSPTDESNIRMIPAFFSKATNIDR